MQATPTYLNYAACRYVVNRVRAANRAERMDRAYGVHLDDLTREHSTNPNGRSHLVEAPGMTDGTSRRHHLSAQDDAAQYSRAERKTATTTVDGGHRPLGSVTYGMVIDGVAQYSHSVWRVDGRGHGSSKTNGAKTAGKARKTRRKRSDGAKMTNAERTANSRWRKRATSEGYVCPQHGATLTDCATDCRKQALGLSDAPAPVAVAESAGRGW